jgi:hypothetical protein
VCWTSSASAGCPCAPCSTTANGLGDLLELPERLADRRLEQLVHEGLLTSGPADRGTPDYHMPAVLHQYACERFAMEDAQSHAMAGV